MKISNTKSDYKKLKKIYIEPTNTCNLRCRTCMRNTWNEKDSFMSEETFINILKSIEEISPRPSVFFGGLGEPLNHPDILKMIEHLKTINVKVDLITNGILLSKKISKELIKVGLNRLWISIDGATPESYLDIRLGSNLPLILRNIKELQSLKKSKYSAAPKIGIAFVALKRNISDLPKVLDIGINIGADEFSISNVLPYTPELNKQFLYDSFIGTSNYFPKNYNILLPPMDINLDLLNDISRILDKIYRGNSTKKDNYYNFEGCPFIEKQSTSIRYDGALSPCLPFMHKHQIFLENKFRIMDPFIIGSINQKTLMELWNDPIYTKRRKDITEFDFLCNQCTLCYGDNSNSFDCFSSYLPSCGGCLWAAGFIKCP